MELQSFYYKDKLGKQTEITVKVEGQYMLMQVQYYSVEVKARNTVTETALKYEIMKDMPFALETVLELTSPNESGGLIIYENMTDVANGKEKERGMFELDSDRPRLSLTVGNNVRSFDMSGNATQMFYWYFGMNTDFSQKSGLRSSPPPSERLAFDLTEKYKAIYPEAEVETARLIIWTRPYLNKFMPIN